MHVWESLSFQVIEEAQLLAFLVGQSFPVQSPSISAILHMERLMVAAYTFVTSMSLVWPEF